LPFYLKAAFYRSADFHLCFCSKTILICFRQKAINQYINS
jgi:hypothetical protein